MTEQTKDEIVNIVRDLVKIHEELKDEVTIEKTNDVYDLLDELAEIIKVDDSLMTRVREGQIPLVLQSGQNFYSWLSYRESKNA